MGFLSKIKVVTFVERPDDTLLRLLLDMSIVTCVDTVWILVTISVTIMKITPLEDFVSVLRLPWENILVQRLDVNISSRLVRWKIFSNSLSVRIPVYMENSKCYTYINSVSISSTYRCIGI